MIVELVGPPGCGKTTVAREAIAHFRRIGIDVVAFASLSEFRRNRRSHWMDRTHVSGKFCLTAVRVAARLAWLIVLHGGLQWNRWRKARRVLAILLLTEQLRCNSSDTIVILHDGFVQKLWATLIESIELRGLKQIEAILEDYYRFSGIGCILLSVPDGILMERVCSRPSKGRFNQNMTEKRRIEFPRWIDYHKAVARRLPSRAIVGEIDATRESSELTALIYRRFMACGQPQGFDSKRDVAHYEAEHRGMPESHRPYRRALGD